MRNTFFLSAISLAFLFLITPVFAQTSPSSQTGTFNFSTNYSALTSNVGKGGASLTVNPQYPAPGDTVSFSLQDFQDNLNLATITWTINGKTVSSGQGNSEFQTTAGPAGSSQVVQATITTQNGTTITKSVTISPASVDLLWQAHSYVPPFYKGKALFPLEGVVTVVAFPSFALNNPSSAVYSWKIGGQARPDISGPGKDTITLTGSILLQPIDVEVTVTSQDGSVTAQNNMSLTGTSPVVALYEDSPLYGLLFNESLGTTITLNGQTGLTVEPYFVDSTAPYTNTADFQWSMNNQTISGQNSQTLNVSPPAGQTGNTSVSVTATSNTTPIQTGSANISVNFGNNNNG